MEEEHNCESGHCHIPHSSLEFLNDEGVALPVTHICWPCGIAYDFQEGDGEAVCVECGNPVTSLLEE